MSAIRVTQIHVYPVKSMRGIPLQQAQVTPTGLQHDRRWMVVRSNGRFVTQRDIPQMALVHTGLDENGVRLSRQGHGSIDVPFQRFDGKLITTRVWNDECKVVDQGDEVSAWLTRALDSEAQLRLVSMQPEFRRSLSMASELGNHTSTEFADAAPFLIANEASLDALNSVLQADSHDRVPMNRFRPNIVVQGLDAFAEHRLAELSTNSYAFNLSYPCKRCIVTTIDQDSAHKNPHLQPFKTLQDINPMPGETKAPAFAENAVLARGNGKLIRLGDALRAIFK